MSRRAAIEEEYDKSTGNYSDSKFSFVNNNMLNELGISQYKTKTGDNFISILDPNDGEGFYGEEVFIHSNIGADRRTFVCPAKVWNKPCPICEEVNRIREADSKDERLKPLYPRRRYLFFIIDSDSPESVKKGVMWYDAPTKVKDGIVQASKDKRSGQTIDVSHPTEGRDIAFSREKTGPEAYNVDYKGFQLVDKTPITKDWEELMMAISFEDILKVSTYDEMAEAFAGQPAATKQEKKEEPVSDRRQRSEQPADESRSRRSEASVEQPATEPEPVQEEKSVDEGPAAKIARLKEELKKRKNGG